MPTTLCSFVSFAIFQKLKKKRREHNNCEKNCFLYPRTPSHHWCTVHTHWTFHRKPFVLQSDKLIISLLFLFLSLSVSLLTYITYHNATIYSLCVRPAECHWSVALLRFASKKKKRKKTSILFMCNMWLHETCCKLWDDVCFWVTIFNNDLN